MRIESFVAQVILSCAGMLLALVVVLAWDGASDRPVLWALLSAAFTGVLPVPLHGRAIRQRILIVSIASAGILALWHNPDRADGPPPWWVAWPLFAILLSGVTGLFVPVGLGVWGALLRLRSNRWGTSR